MSDIKDFKYPRPGTTGREMACPKCGWNNAPTILYRTRIGHDELIVSCGMCDYDYGTVGVLDA